MSERTATPADFFARRTHFIDHLAPIWKAMDWRGKFYVPAGLVDYARAEGVEAIGLESQTGDPMAVVPPGGTPLVTCAYHGMMQTLTARPQRRVILMEHGVGITFGPTHNGYAGGQGMRRKVKLFLAPNEYIRNKTAKSLPHAAQVIIGTPKLDEWAGKFEEGAQRKAEGKPVVCVAFHWDGSRVEPEAGTAYPAYKSILSELARQSRFTLIGHGHPKAMEMYAADYEAMGIEAVWDFREVMRRADLYINDCSSTMYEFLVTGKPVILLNAPWFRKEKRFGIRFWDYTDIGPQVNEAEELLSAIEMMLKYPGQFLAARAKAVHELYPHMGTAATRAAAAIEGYCGAVYG